MTREEQIISEAKKHHYDSINCYNAFLHGVEWADEHPNNVWHDASEEPDGDYKVVIVNEFGNLLTITKHEVILDYNNWRLYCENEFVTMWAYIADLLPKGGER